MSAQSAGKSKVAKATDSDDDDGTVSDVSSVLTDELDSSEEEEPVTAKKKAQSPPAATSQQKTPETRAPPARFGHEARGDPPARLVKPKKPTDRQTKFAEQLDFDDSDEEQETAADKAKVSAGGRGREGGKADPASSEDDNEEEGKKKGQAPPSRLEKPRQTPRDQSRTPRRPPARGTDRSPAKRPQQSQRGRRDDDSDSGKDSDESRKPRARDRSKAGTTGKERSASRLSQAETVAASSSSRSRSTGTRRRPGGRGDSDDEEDEDEDKRKAKWESGERAGGYGAWSCCSGCGCAGCSGFCIGFWGWSGWGWMKKKSAFLVALLLCALGAALVASAGPIGEGWYFAEMAGVKLGGIGYCTGGSCVTAVAYQAPGVSESSLFTSTRVLSVMLLLFGAGGIICFLIILLTFITYIGGCCQDCMRSPCSALTCSFDPESQRDTSKRKNDDRMVDRAAQHDNRIGPDDWAALSTEEKTVLRDRVRAKNRFERTVDVTLAWTVLWCVLLLVWMGQTDAEGGLAFDAMRFGVPILAVLWLFFRNVYRTPPGVKSKLERGLDSVRDTAVDSARGAGRRIADKSRDVQDRMSSDGRRGQSGSRSRSRSRR